ncbi:D-aminoacyl-tRNA deacylase [Marivirga harenae]|uniref:D-aminoacyl-tRNA deacylase n=1 Tax=Marivirga harenae TaxID=2010992 RepID=UPI0026E076EA|nr:D-aminoacyl-tRNA deacylase [Marivirga harenae]WKV11878.1 D-aminoacyl-tRNA deacylase [Marivirga harenae]
MIAVLQRVTEASVKIEEEIKGKIKDGLMILLGIEEADSEEDIEWLSRKIINMRIFNDENGVMNRSLLDVHGEILLISQFTLHASTKKGNRPSYIKAAKPDIAIPLYEKMLSTLDMEIPIKIQSGEFGADMKVSLVNDGPVTIILDSKDKK